MNPLSSTEFIGSALPSMTLTVVIPVKNEAKNLPACLASLSGIGPVLVVDSESTDDTLAIAESAGAKVIAFHWPGGFPKKRNWVLETQTFDTEWVLFLDADERLTPAFRTALPQALAQDGTAGYWLNYHNHFMGRILHHGVPQRKLALFRVGAGRYERIDDPGWSALDMEVHEHPILDGTVGEIAAPIEHEDFRGLHHFIARHNEYSSWEARRFIALAADRPAWAALTRRQRGKYTHLSRWWFAPAYFLFTYVLRAGFLDGGQGFAYALFKAAYFMEVRLKIREMTLADAGRVA
jgi:glycosyltransferase involved in cell wall biosynthesis